jgi:membrane protein DedA with SNARE-associated domain
VHDTLLQLVATYGYVIVFVLVGVESLGVPLPGETALVAAAALAAQGHLSIVGVVGTAACAAIIGDNCGFWIGRTGGLALARKYGRVVRFDESKLNIVRGFFAAHGGKTVFFGRFIALLRTWAAFFAGTSGMPYPAFMAYNALGGIVWSCVFGALGFVFGRNLPLLEKYLGRFSMGLLAAVVIAAATIYFVRRRRAPQH